MPIEFVPCRFPLDGASSLEHHDGFLDFLRHLHQSLADPGAVVRMPANPTSPVTDHEATIAYWETLHYLLLILLGWTNIGKGMSWFYQNDQADAGDARLRLVREVWDAEGQLTLYAAFAFGASFHYDEARQRLLSRTPPVNHARIDMRKFDGDDEWRQLYAWQLPYFRRRHPFVPGEGGNPLHLGRHCLPVVLERPVQSDGPAPAVMVDRASRRAVLVLERLAGWHYHLTSLGADLPDLGEHSWHVDVFTKPVGWLGTFRRSRVTGLWFQGRHRIHMAGN